MTAELIIWAKESLGEMKAVHDHYYKDCKGGCPTHYLIDGLKTVIPEAEKAQEQVLHALKASIAVLRDSSRLIDQETVKEIRSAIALIEFVQK